MRRAGPTTASRGPVAAGTAATATAAAAVVVLALLAAGCSQSKGPNASGAGSTTTRAPASSTTTTVSPAGTWSKAISVAPKTDLSVVTCTAPGACIIGSATGQTYRLFLDKVSALGPAVPSPSPQGVAYISCGVSISAGRRPT